jgi:hypothetical protein
MKIKKKHPKGKTVIILTESQVEKLIIGLVKPSKQ